MVRVVLVDDHARVRRLLGELIKDDGRLQVVGEAENGREAIETATRLQPDAVILDQEMPEMTGTEALPELVRIVPKVVVVMFSSGPRPETEAIATAAGADAYFEKTDPVPDLLDAVVDLVAAAHQLLETGAALPVEARSPRSVGSPVSSSPEERPMHAVVTQVTIEDFDRARANLHDNVVPQASQAPGFVAGYWTRITEDRGIGMMVFESEDAAKAAQEQVRSAPRVGATVTDVQVAEVVAHA